MRKHRGKLVLFTLLAYIGCSGSSEDKTATSEDARTRIALTGTTSGGRNVCMIGEVEVLFDGTVVATEPTDCDDPFVLVALATGDYTVRPAAGYTCESDGEPIDCAYTGPSEGVPVTVVPNENVQVSLPFEIGPDVITVTAGTTTVVITANPVCGDGQEECDHGNEVCTSPDGAPFTCHDICTPPDGECPEGEYCLPVKPDTSAAAGAAGSAGSGGASGSGGSAGDGGTANTRLDEIPGVCVPNGNGGASGSGGAAGAAGESGMAGNGGAAGDAGAGGASGSGGAAGEGGEAGMAGEAGAGGAAGSSEGGAAGEGGTTGGSGGCNGNDANCPGDEICVDNECVPPSSGGGTTSTGGSTGSGGTIVATGGTSPATGGTGSGCVDDSDGTFTIDIVGINVDHIYCQGREVANCDHRPDEEAQLFGAWSSLGSDALQQPGSSAPLAYHVGVSFNPARSFRFQCTLKKADGAPGDELRYTCGTPGLNSGESFSVSDGVGTVPNLHNSTNCQVD